MSFSAVGRALFMRALVTGIAAYAEAVALALTVALAVAVALATS